MGAPSFLLLWIGGNMLLTILLIGGLVASVALLGVLWARASGARARVEDSVAALPPVEFARDFPAIAVDEDVQFTVYRPCSVQADKWYSLLTRCASFRRKSLFFNGWSGRLPVNSRSKPLKNRPPEKLAHRVC